MMSRIDRFTRAVVMKHAVPAYWQFGGLTLLYTFSSD